MFRVSGREGELKRSLRTLLTSRESTGPSRGKGWGKRSAEGKGPANTEGTKGYPTPRPEPPKTRGRLRAVGKYEKHRKQSVARPGGVAPGASAGRLALRDLSPGAAGLAAESEGGSLGPRALRRACPRGSRGKLQPDPKKRLGPTPHLHGRRRHRGLHPRGAGRATGAPSAAGFRCGSLGSLDVDVSGIQPFPFSLRPGKSSTPSPAMAKKVWAAC